MTPTHWRARALCRPGSGLDPELFFPVAAPGSQPYETQVAEAKSICAGCAVRAECLKDVLAVETRKDYGGVQGGTTEQERAELRARLDGQEIPRRISRYAVA